MSVETHPICEQDAALSEVRFSVDLITFYHPRAWGLDDLDQLHGLSAARPDFFWLSMLDAVAAAGIEGLETTFSPFNWQDATSAFGSLEGFSRQLEERRLSVSGAFFSELARSLDIGSASALAGIIDMAGRYADFIAACGGNALVAGLPLRRSRNHEQPLFVDLEYAKHYADILNRIGAETIRRGVRLALHTEAHSVCADARDVDLFMLLTDPIYVGLCPDAAHLLVSGSDPVAVASRHAERIVTAHWKDAVCAMPQGMPIDETIYEQHQPYFCRLGAGAVDWHAWARLYRDQDIGGWAVLELDAAADPAGEMSASLQFATTAIDAVYPRRHRMHVGEY